VNSTRTETPGPEISVRRAVHAGSDYDVDIAECSSAIRAKDGLALVAHFTVGTWDFEVTRPGLWPRQEGAAAVFERTGQQLGLAMTELDAVWEHVDGSALIRIVLQGDKGALFNVVKVAGQMLFGATFYGAPDRVDASDRQLIGLADGAARRIGAASMQWGGFRLRESSGDLWRPFAALPMRDTARPHLTVAELVSFPESAARTCKDLLHWDDLHYVALHRRGKLVWRADIFDDPALSPFFQRVTPDGRRRGYDRLARQLTLQARLFRQALALVRSERLTRLVLDVARGAIFAIPLTEEVSIIGATLVQNSSHEADRKLRTMRDPVLAALRARSSSWG
jgi:hypothetical protein